MSAGYFYVCIILVKREHWKTGENRASRTPGAELDTSTWLSVLSDPGSDPRRSANI